MRPVRPRVRCCVVALGMLGVLVGSGCAQKLASLPRPSLRGCGGLFTTVALPHVPQDEQRALEAAVPPLLTRTLNLRLRRSYYRILAEEEGRSVGEADDAFVTRRLVDEQAPPGLLAGVELRKLEFAVPPTPAERQALRQAVFAARAPLAARLQRVAARMTAAIGHPEVSCELDARLRLGAGAEVGFRSHRILVGPSLVLLAESDEGLAFVLGHELAHVVHHHTTLRALQDFGIRLLTFGYGNGVAGETLAGILSQGSVPAFNRDKECEADYYALEYMRAAGYRPEAAAPLWRAVLALRSTTSRPIVPFVSEYPPEAERVLRLAHWTAVDMLRDSSAAPLVDEPSEEDSATIRDLSAPDAIETFGVVLK